MNSEPLSGAIPSIPDERDYLWEEYPKAVTPFNWEKGFDVEQIIGKQIKTEDQNGSGSCGGQAFSYYGEVLSTIYDKEYTDKSAKFIYAPVAVPGGGSEGRRLVARCKDIGFSDEALCPSYENGKAPTEAFMARTEDITPEAIENAKIDKALEYARITDLSIEGIASAVQANYGCVIGIAGSNNGTWRGLYPQAPKQGEKVWWHWLFVGKVKMIKGKKYLGVLNSWGTKTGDRGWQWISEDYVNAGKMSNGNNVIFEAWTLVYNEENRVKESKMATLRNQIADLARQVIKELLRQISLFK